MRKNDSQNCLILGYLNISELEQRDNILHDSTLKCNSVHTGKKSVVLSLYINIST